MRKALTNCCDQYYEYFLKFVCENDDEDYMRKNREKLTMSVQAGEIDFSYVQSNDFKNEWDWILLCLAKLGMEICTGYYARTKLYDDFKTSYQTS
jgi:hypothetical protein